MTTVTIVRAWVSPALVVFVGVKVDVVFQTAED
jgi:hypothetical protein